MLDVICCGNTAHFDYLVGWCAYCVQHPEKPAEVAVIMRGGQGTGKGMTAQVMRRIFRHHALHITHTRHLTGNFNAHLVDALFLFLDEAFWGGDKQGEGVLKTLITEHSVQIEPKGIDSFPMANRLKIMMASNNEWVVPVSADARRYAIFDVSDAWQGDHPYFDRLGKALDDGETAAFLHYLLMVNSDGFNIRAVPNTAGLTKQKLVGADSVTRFWEDCLREGAIVGTGSDAWPATITTQLLHAAYVDHARQHGERYPAIDARMGERLEELNAGCSFRKRRLPAISEGASRPWGRELDQLEEHRAAFERALRIPAGGYPWEGREDA
jgi:phage/plasmid-associated DNA primase